MKLEVLAAQQGDCLLLHSETPAGPGLILIDGGPAGVSTDTLIPRLIKLRDERSLAEGQPLVIDLVIVSHVDDDHIKGVIDLFQQMLDRRTVREPPLFRVKGLWHNSFDRVLGHVGTGGPSGVAQFGAASMQGLVGEADDGPATDHAGILASIPQGVVLRSLAKELGIPLNGPFGGELIQAFPGTPVAREVAGVELTVLSPHPGEMAELQKQFDEWLVKHPPPRRTRASLLAALDDTSVTNLSSIVLLARAGGRTILLTGDARSDMIVSGLTDCGLLGAGGTIDIGVMKMPHHGSIRNVDEDFLRRVTSGNYVFSGNGQHGNPDRETLDLLFSARPHAPINLHFTYPPADIDRVRRGVRQRARASKPGKAGPAGPAWSDATDSLTAVLSPPPPGVTVVQTGPLVI